MGTGQICLREENLSFNNNLGTAFFPQLKSLFEIFTFVSERNIKYHYLFLASLILVACYGNSVSRFSTIQLRLINKFHADFESYFMRNYKFLIVQYLVQAIKNGQCIDTGNIVYTRNRTKTNKTKNNNRKLNK